MLHLKVLTNEAKTIWPKLADWRTDFYLAGEPIDILSVQEILATKAYTIGRRGSLKDYLDLFSGLSSGQSSLSEIIDLAERKYQLAFNARLFLEQLLYLDDLPAEEVMMLSSSVPTKEEMADFFRQKIQALEL
ncbi:MAG: hypothetical protein WDZ85_00885 [Candidatus Paceibacterota bacterium]